MYVELKKKKISITIVKHSKVKLKNSQMLAHQKKRLYYLGYDSYEEYDFLSYTCANKLIINKYLGWQA